MPLSDVLTRKFDTLREALAQPVGERHDMTPPRSAVLAQVLHCYRPPSNDKIYAIWIENRGGAQQYFVCGAYGKRTANGMLKVDPKGAYSCEEVAMDRMSGIVNEKIRLKGYVDVESPAYFGTTPADKRVSFFDVINDKKVDVSRIIGYSVGARTAPQAAPVKATTTKQRQQNIEIGSGRVRRSVNL